LIDAVADFQQAVEQRWAEIDHLARREVAAATTALSDRAHPIQPRTHAAVEPADERLATRSERLLIGRGRALDGARRDLDHASSRLERRAPDLLVAHYRSLDAAASRLALLDQANLLARGWSITRTATGEVVRSTDDVESGTIITTQVADGLLTSRIETS
jgi:exodeoxyribonuclease VII large subunit